MKIHRGFTIIESVIVILITGILFAACSIFIAGPVTGYLALSRRAELVSVLDASLERVVRDLRQAVPNSIRVKPSAGQYPAIEYIPALQAVRYQAQGSGFLDFSNAASTFNIEGVFSSDVTSAVTNGDGFQLVINNQAVTTTGGTSDNPLAGVNLYNSTANTGPYPPAGSHVITPSTSTITFNTSSTPNTVTMNPPFQFAYSSPSQRMYVVDKTQAPVSYVCDLNFGLITRYWDYPIQATQPNLSTVAPLSNPTTQSALLAKNITTCNFTYSPGASGRAGVVTLRLGLKSATGDVVELVRQAQVATTP